MDFNKIVSEYKDRIINVCFRFVLNMEDAEDITQEVFIEVYRSYKSFQGNCAVYTWIYRIAVNKSLDHIRKGKRKKRFSQVKSILGMTQEIENIPSENDPQSVLENADTQKVISMALDKLPERQRTAFVLSKIDSFSNKQITEIMDLSLSSVESLLFRAKTNLQQHLCNFYKKNEF